jgi:MoaA/NifB/PqqE/SkfB family radical SAM enzyme
MTSEIIPYSQLGKTPRQNLLETLPLQMPLSMHVEPTNICNFHCVSCPQALPDYKDITGYHQHMDFALYEKIMRDIKDMGRLKSLKLFGYGESMTHPELGRMIRLAKDLDVADRIEMTSNCSRLSEKMARELIEGPLDYLRVSIYALDQDKHQEFTQTKVRIETIFENLVRLRKMRDEMGATRPHIYVKMFETISPEDEARFREKYKDIADELHLEMWHNMSGVDGVDERLHIEGPKRTPHKICPMPFYQSSVAANGDVTICCIDWSWSSKVGNLKDQSLKEIWYGPALNEVRRRMLEGQRSTIKSCVNCTWDWYHPDNLDDMTPEKTRQILGYYDAARQPA